MDGFELQKYLDFFFLSKERLSEERLDLLRLVNGEVFYRIVLWPKNSKLCSGRNQ
jgi:hypothetical protein